MRYRHVRVKMDCMTNMLNSHIEVDLKMLRIGGVLAGTGMILASAGTALVGLTCAKAARDWVRQLDRSPGAVASERLHQARDASKAAMEAWRSSHPVNGAVSR
jgi:hypothetical protein